ncbi:hypothetical protein GCM10011366_21080 [Ornithinimicrobium tianjinense]|uniref:Uncharacterized protein n=1 Tax=Ornithinimicrobium tianjinense TaxID=1195761 RepID=A0A917BSR7_9MICO|nr:hypothetical protein GCM10011366_21080 [Ornithinimicrobium tianjinense]
MLVRAVDTGVERVRITAGQAGDSRGTTGYDVWTARLRPQPPVVRPHPSPPGVHTVNYSPVTTADVRKHNGESRVIHSVHRPYDDDELHTRADRAPTSLGSASELRDDRLRDDLGLGAALCCTSRALSFPDGDAALSVRVRVSG